MEDQIIPDHIIKTLTPPWYRYGDLTAFLSNTAFWIFILSLVILFAYMLVASGRSAAWLLAPYVNLIQICESVRIPIPPVILWIIATKIVEIKQYLNYEAEGQGLYYIGHYAIIMKLLLLALILYRFGYKTCNDSILAGIMMIVMPHIMSLCIFHYLADRYDTIEWQYQGYIGNEEPRFKLRLPSFKRSVITPKAPKGSRVWENTSSIVHAGTSSYTVEPAGWKTPQEDYSPSMRDYYPQSGMRTFNPSVEVKPVYTPGVIEPLNTYKSSRPRSIVEMKRPTNSGQNERRWG